MREGRRGALPHPFLLLVMVYDDETMRNGWMGGREGEKERSREADSSGEQRREEELEGAREWVEEGRGGGGCGSVPLGEREEVVA